MAFSKRLGNIQAVVSLLASRLFGRKLQWCFLVPSRYEACCESRGWVASVRSLEPTSIFWSFPSVAATNKGLWK